MPLNTPPFKNIKTLVRDISISAHSLRASTENVSWLWSCWSVPFLSSSLSLLPVRSGMSPSHYCPLPQLTSSSSPLLTSTTSLPFVKLATSLSHLRHLKILVENIPCFQHTEKGMYCELHNILPELALVSQLKKSSLLQSRVATPGGNMTWYFSKRTYERYTKTDFIVSWSTDLWTPSICPSNINIWSYSFHLSVEFVLLCSLPSSTSLSLKSSGGPQPDQCWALQITQVLHNAHASFLSHALQAEPWRWHGLRRQPSTCRRPSWTTSPLQCIAMGDNGMPEAEVSKSPHQSPSSSPLTSYLQFEGAF